jgi:hypothetical protein
MKLQNAKQKKKCNTTMVQKKKRVAKKYNLLLNIKTPPSGHFLFFESFKLIALL